METRLDNRPHILLVDCSAFCYRAYYSMPAMRRIADGEPTGALLGFASLIYRMIGAVRADQPDYAAAVFDYPGKTFRSDIFPEYKMNRDPSRRLELEKQLPLMRPVADVLGLTPIEHEGFEADDVLATLATRAMNAGIRSTIVSSDKDMAQIVVDDWIEIVDPMQRARDPSVSSRRLEADAIKKFGVPPSQVPDVQALAGDSVDGYTGIPGVGLERAAAMIRRFGSLESVLENYQDVRWPQIRHEIGKRKDWARLCLKLATLRRDVPVTLSFEDMAMRPIIKSHLIQVVKAINPDARVEALFGLDLQDVRIVERVSDPLEWWREELIASGQPFPSMPQCGFYETRLARGGPWVPARIWREPYIDPVTSTDSGMDLLKCEVDGRAKDPMAMFDRLSAHPVKESHFEFETADIAHAKAYRDGDPKATPHKKIDIIKQPAPRNPRRSITS